MTTRQPRDRPSIVGPRGTIAFMIFLGLLAAAMLAFGVWATWTDAYRNWDPGVFPI